MCCVCLLKVAGRRALPASPLAVDWLGVRGTEALHRQPGTPPLLPVRAWSSPLGVAQRSAALLRPAPGACRAHAQLPANSSTLVTHGPCRACPPTSLARMQSSSWQRWLTTTCRRAPASCPWLFSVRVLIWLAGAAGATMGERSLEPSLPSARARLQQGLSLAALLQDAASRAVPRTTCMPCPRPDGAPRRRRLRVLT